MQTTCATFLVLLVFTPTIHAQEFNMAHFLAQRHDAVQAALQDLVEDPSKRAGVTREGAMLRIEGALNPDLMDMNNLLCLLVSALHTDAADTVRHTLLRHGFLEEDFAHLQDTDVVWMTNYCRPLYARIRQNFETMKQAHDEPSDAEIRDFLRNQEQEQAACRTRMVLDLTGRVSTLSQRALIAAALDYQAPRTEAFQPIGDGQDAKIAQFRKQLQDPR